LLLLLQAVKPQVSARSLSLQHVQDAHFGAGRLCRIMHAGSYRMARTIAEFANFGMLHAGQGAGVTAQGSGFD
jgi:hypothetical protein